MLPSCAVHNSSRRAEDQDSAPACSAFVALGGKARIRHSRAHGPRPRPLLTRRLRLGRARRHRAGAAMARARGHRRADRRAVEPPRLSALCGRADPGGQIRAMLDALEANGWLADTAAVITGYLPSPAHVATARLAVERVRRANPRRGLPVRSGVRRRAGRALSRPRPRPAAIRDQLLPLASHATPNRFELSWLAGLPVGDATEARQAALGARRSDGARHVHPGRRQPPRQRPRHRRRRASPASCAAVPPPRTAPAICSPRCISAITSTAIRAPTASAPPYPPSRPASPPAWAGMNCRSRRRVLYGRAPGSSPRRRCDAGRGTGRDGRARSRTGRASAASKPSSSTRRPAASCCSRRRLSASS